MSFYSKGESWGNTDASVGMTDDEQKEYAAQNGGHAFLVARSQRIIFESCKFRLCGSVGAFYSMSSNDVKLTNCFANAASLGYACYAFDSWAGDKTVSGFSAHYSSLTDCSAYKEGYTYGSKGCVVNEDDDCTTEINGGYYADAFPNGSSRDIGYAFGASSSKMIVSGAYVSNCASIGYTGTTNNTDYTHLTIDNVIARGLRKTVHQTEDTSVGRMYWSYSNCDAEVNDTGVWVGDGDLTREESSYAALPNSANNMYGSFSQCRLSGATYGFINTTRIFGFIKFDLCDIETNGFLWYSLNIGSGASGDKLRRGIHFTNCSIEDLSAETTPYTETTSSVVYTYIDLSTSTITLNSVRDIELASITTPATFIDMYRFPRDEVGAFTAVAGTNPLYPDSAKRLNITPDSATRYTQLPREDKYKYMDFYIHNASGAQSLGIRDYTNVTTYATLTPGQTALVIGDGANYRVSVLP